MKRDSIFRRYYEEKEFIDRKNSFPRDAIDVIIPIINTNELFKINLTSIFREIPVNRLIIGNGGSTDDSLEILKEFPRVEIIDQTKHKTLGFCIAELISLVKTDWFIYLHSDVYIPERWYDEMKKNKNKFDWFESDSRITTMINFESQNKTTQRAYSGAQMGKKKAFEQIIPKIDDDYLYRNEDIVFKDLICQEGFNYGRILDTFYYHQVMNKKGEKEPEFEMVNIRWIPNRQFEIETYLKQVKGIIKYSYPKPYLIKEVNDPLNLLKKSNAINIDEFIKWVKKTNFLWLEYLDLKQKQPSPTLILKICYKLRDLLNPLIKKLLRF